MTRRERMTARMERREEWAGRAHSASDAAFTAAHRAVDGIPFGQPVLVGHHSEGPHRRALDRSDKAMSRAVERSKMADRHESVADNLERALDVSIFSDDDDAPEALHAKIARLETERARVVELNKAIRREVKSGLTEGWIARTGASEAEQHAILDNARVWGSPIFPPYVTSNLGGRIAAAKQRLAAIERQNERREAAAASAGGVTLEGTDYVALTFAEKPPRETLDALKAAGFHWSGGSWCGYRAAIPPAVAALLEEG